ncbi:MAG: right-handed parallel beta-helix repeat-containing protein [Candidatus Eisenbacteria bacterium]|nr:right-handed parallel beta-helix repeat-containing protein [Candidatus Eisenbacteria bacterium]
MRSLSPLFVLLFLLVSTVPAVAGDNPDARIFIEFENDSNYIEPGTNTIFSGTVYLTGFGSGGGVSGVAFRFDRAFDAIPISFTPTNSGLLIGDVEVEGCAIAWPSCLYPDGNGRVAVMDFEYFYSGGGGNLRVLPHTTHGDSLYDCDTDVDRWCVTTRPSGHGGVNASPPPGGCAGWPTAWNVPSNAPTIQAGIDSAAVGDTVVVAAGTYYEHDVTLKSGVIVTGATGDPTDVVVDADSLGRVFYAISVNSATRLADLTLTGGHAVGTGLDEQGGGMLCRSTGAMTIENCVISGNAADGEGGGLKSWNADPRIISCRIQENYAGSGGGGVNLQGDSASVVHCVITGNSAYWGGGGVYLSGGGAYLSDCTIAENTVLLGGLETGGGAYFGLSSRPNAVDCVFAGNTADQGGGVYCYAASGGLTGCTLAGNTGETYGGGILIENGSPFLTNCTIVWNDAPTGAGVLTADTSPSIALTIIAYNRTGEAFACLGSGFPILSCTDVYGNDGGDWTGCIASSDSVSGNFSADPLFCGGVENPLDSLSLQGISPCALDTCGTGSAYGVIGARPVGCRPVVVWTGMGDGSSWSDTANWDPNRVPTASDHAYLPGDLSNYVVLLNESAVVLELTIDSSFSYSPTLTLGSDTLTVLEGGENSGEIFVSDGAFFEVAAGGTFVNESGGTVILSDGSLIGDGFFVNGGTVRKSDPEKSRGFGAIAVDFDNRRDDPGDGAIVVEGGVLVIEGEFTNAGSLVVHTSAMALFDPGDGAFRAGSYANGDDGVIVIEEGAELQIDGAGTSFVNELGSLVVLEGGDITGTGTFVNYGRVEKRDPVLKSRAMSRITALFDNMHDDPGDGAIVVDEGVLSIENEFANAGSVLVNTNAQMLLDPGDGAFRGVFFDNTNYVRLLESSSLGILGATTVLENGAGGLILLEGDGAVSGDGLLRNYGTFRKEDPSKGARAIANLAADFHNLFDDPGDGAIVVADGTLNMQGEVVNHGTVTVDSGATLAVADTSGVKAGGGTRVSGSFLNTGTVTVAEAGTFTTEGNVSNGTLGDWDLSGTLEVRAGARFDNYGFVGLDTAAVVVNDGVFDLKENAVLEGSGLFDSDGGDFYGNGVIRPGCSAGVLTFFGDFLQSATSELEIEIGGTAPGAAYDRLLVEGGAVFDGAVYVTLTGGFEPTEGDSFSVVSVSAGFPVRNEFDCFSGLQTSGGLFLEPVEAADFFSLVARDSTTGNAAPSAAQDAAETNAVTPITLHVLTNDTDGDLDPLRIAELSDALTAGDVKIDPGDTTLTYTPSPGFAGLDSLTYRVTDCQGGVDSALVVVTVYRAPRIWAVPGDAPTIAAGLDSTLAGDTVEVAADTYHEHDLVMPSGVVLRGATGDPEDVIIDADSLGRVLYCVGLDSSTVVSGLTLFGGYHVNGAGMYCSGSDMTIRSCIFSWNVASGGGGGLRVYECDPLIRDCVFDVNDALSGGGVSFVRSSSLMDSCEIVWNDAVSGGGVHLHESEPSIRSCTFTENEATSSGAGIFSYSSEPVLTNVILAFNDGGAAVYCSGTGGPTLDCCDVYGNEGGDYVGCLSGMEGTDGNFSGDPYFCGVKKGADPFLIDAASSCAPDQNPYCGLVGARPVGCASQTAVDGPAEEPPAAFRLETNRPNPFNPETAIRFAVPKAGRVSLVVYDVSGRRVAVLADGPFDAGDFERVWRGVDDTGRPVGSGIYFARMRAEGFQATRKMVLVR